MKPHIMFVDDEPCVIDSFRRMLRPFSQAWETSFQTDGFRACAAIQERPVDILVTDVRMPLMSGIELLKKLKNDATTRDVAVIAITGQHDRDLKRQALDAGAADLLDKPIEFEDLLARLRSSLRIKAYQDELKEKNQSLEQRVLDRTRKLERSRLEIVARLATAGEFHDGETGQHVVRVAHYSRLIAQGLNLPESRIQTIFLAAPLHDVGKIGISDSVLLKRGRLTTEERQLMQEHCAIGARMLGNEFHSFLESPLSSALREGETAVNMLDDPVLATAREIALTHHEWWDGTGYPAGLAGEAIPLCGRIVALSDVFDALTTARPYKTAFTVEHAMSLITNEVGTHFDPRVYSAFLSVFEDVERTRQRFTDRT